MTWKQILKNNSKDFIEQLKKNDILNKNLKIYSETLQELLLQRFKKSESIEDTSQVFRELISNGRAKINKQDYDSFMVTEVYSFFYFLDKYERLWDILIFLAEENILPLSESHLNIFNIGSGPGNDFYPINDFYTELYNFLGAKKISISNNIKFYSVEKSKSMNHFFTEFNHMITNKRKSVNVELFSDDFNYFDLGNSRYKDLEKREQDIWNAIMKGEETDDTVGSAHSEATKLFRYKMVVMSNFLTTENRTVDKFKTELESFFEDANAGTIFIIIGSTLKSYNRDVYEPLKNIAQKLNFKCIEKEKQFGNEDSQKVIKEFQINTCKGLAKLAKLDFDTFKEKTNGFCSEEVSSKKVLDYKILLARKGR